MDSNCRISLQPIEISKYLLLIFIAKHLIVKLDKINTFKIGIISPFTLTLPYVIVLLSQPDFLETQFWYFQPFF